MSVVEIVVVVAALCYLATQVQLHRAATGYSPVRHAVSDYGVGPTAPLFRASVAANTIVLLGVLVELLMNGCSWTAPTCPATVWLSVAVLARIAVGLFPTDLPGRPRTATGRLHLLAAIVQFTAVYEYLLDAPSVTHPGPFATAAHWLTLAATAGLIGICCALLPLARRWFGLAERVFLWSSTAAVICTALTLTHR